MRINFTNIGIKLAGSILLPLFFVFQVAGQHQDCIFTHFDKSFYISGETIWFKVYLLNDSGETKSRVLHVDLVNHKNQTVARQKLLIDNLTSNGSITLPMDSEEGYYRFRAYTHYNLNFLPPFVYETSIPIYQLDKEDFLHSDQVESEKNQLPEMLGISVVSSQEIYHPRDSLAVSLEIDGSNTEGEMGNYSVSVVPFEIASHESQFYNNYECTDRSFKGGLWINPQRSLLLEGSLKDQSTKLNVTSGLISVYLDRTSQLIRAPVREGKIKVPVPDYYGPGIFQILNLNPYTPSVFEFTPEAEHQFESPYYHSDQPTRNPVVENYMNRLKKRRKIIELFDLYKSGEIKHSTVQELIPDAVYYAKDYQQIYSFEEFINEAIRNVKVRTIDGAKTVRLFNKDNGNLYIDHPWYLVDGFLTFDENKVLNTQYQDIMEVRLYSTTSTLAKYFTGYMGRNGVMEIITRDVKYTRDLKNNPNVVEIDGFTSPQQFKNILALNERKATPDLRGVIYWAPNVYTNTEGQGQITIPLSDDTGKFAVVVMGRSNFHQPVMGYCTFEVKQE